MGLERTELCELSGGQHGSYFGCEVWRFEEQEMRERGRRKVAVGCWLLLPATSQVALVTNYR